MATSLSSFRLTGIRPHASSGHRKPDQNRRKTTSSPNWFTPLFGWSSDPDYIGTNNATDAPADKLSDVSDTASSASSKFALGCFTEEKAKQLRKKTTDTSNFHDIMYHSAIASRLASDISDRFAD